MPENVLRELSDCLGQGGFISGADAPEKYMSNWRGPPGARPLAVLRPRDTRDVSRAMRICHAHAQPVVPQGGLTGLVGAARSTSDCVVLSLERMNAVEELDPVTPSITVQAGATLQAVQEAADRANLFYPLDLGARGSSTIGGNLSTNAGGNRVIRYGMSRDSVISLEAVLADGTVVGTLSKMIKNNVGYDLKQLFVGAEGTLGIITRAVLRLQPRPLTQQVVFCGCRDFDAVLQLLRAARDALGPGLTAFEAMWPSFYDFMTERLPQLRRPLAEPHGMYVLLEASGFDPGRDPERLEELLGAQLEAGIMADAVLARSLAESRELWAVRDSVAEFGAVLGPVIGFDISFPIPVLQEAVNRIETALHGRWPEIVALVYGHVGDGNIHINAHVPSVAAQPQAEIAEVVYQIVRELGGSISAEHGIGTAKKPYAAYSRTEAELALMASLKRSLDPKNILNPGKVLDV